MLRRHFQNWVIFVLFTRNLRRGKSRFHIDFFILIWIFLPGLFTHLTDKCIWTVSTTVSLAIPPAISLFLNHKASALLDWNTHAAFFTFFILHNVLNLLLGMINALVLSEKVRLRNWTIVRRGWVEHLHERVASYVLVLLQKFIDLLFEVKTS